MDLFHMTLDDKGKFLRLLLTMHFFEFQPPAIKEMITLKQIKSQTK